MSNRKISININDCLSDEIAVDSVLKVIQEGKISNNGTQYCFVSIIDKSFYVYANLTKKGNYSFTVGLEAHNRGGI